VQLESISGRVTMNSAHGESANQQSQMMRMKQ